MVPRHFADIAWSLHEKANRHTATAFLKALIAVVPYKIHTILTDNGIQFCDLPKTVQVRLRGGKPICSICSAERIAVLSMLLEDDAEWQACIASLL